MVHSLGFRVQDSGLQIESVQFRVGFSDFDFRPFRVRGSGYIIQGIGYRV